MLSVSQQQEEQKDNSAQHLLNCKDYKILFAEDDPTHKVLLTYILNNELDICDIEYARDGSEAHKILKESFEKQSHFDFILLDFSMPIIDGITVIKWYQDKCEQKGICPAPIILMSAFTEEYFQKFNL